MQENNKILDLKQEANIKFSKLCEIAQDIEVNGHNGDQFSRQVVLNAIIKSNNDVLKQILEEALLDQSQTEMLKTLITGIFLAKNNFPVLSQYIETVLDSKLIIDEDFENKESLLLVIDALIEAIKSDNEEIKDRCTNSLFKLYKASCHPESTSIIADQLLQRFMNVLPNKNSIIDNYLELIVKDKLSEINSRLISIDILGRSKSVEFFPVLEDLILNIDNYSNNTKEQLYLLDVITKSIYSIAVSGFSVNFSRIIKGLNELNKAELILSYQDSDIESMDTIFNRIQKRIAHLNELVNSRN